jgi:hypothetical protein
MDPECLTKHPIQTGSGTVGKGIEWHIEDLAKFKEYLVLDIKDDRSA